MAKTILHNILLVILLSITQISFANDLNNVRFTHLTVNDGLSHNNVNTIIQDSKGFIWFGTRNGLCRYDGYEIRKYFHNDDDSTSIAHDFIVKLTIDKKDRMWICTDEGICRYDRTKDNFIQYGGNRIEDTRANTILELSDGTIIAALTSGLFRYNEALDQFERLKPAKGSARSIPTPCYDLLESQDGLLWVGTGNGLYCMDRKFHILDKLPKNNPFSELMKGSYILSLCLDSQGRICVGTHYFGLFIFDPKTQQIQHFDMSNGLSSNAIRSIMDDGDGNLWIGGEFGIDILKHNSTSIHRIIRDREDRSNLNDNAIYALYTDRNSNIWVGTYFGGVNVFFKDYRNFTYYPFGFSDKHLSGKAVREIIRNDANSLWIATEDGGLNLFHETNSRFDHLNQTMKLSYHNIHTLLKDSHGYLWIGTFTGGINRYNPSTGQIEYFNRRNTRMGIDITFSLEESANHNDIWIGSGSGLYKYSYATQRFTKMAHPSLSHHIYYLMTDSQGLLWVGTRHNGVVTYDPETDKAYTLDLGAEFGPFITGIFEDRDHNIWISSNSGGVMLYDRENDKKTFYTTRDGLTSNSVMAIIQDNDGKIWFSTINGLCCLDQCTGHMSSYTTDNGLPTNQFNYASAYKNDDGKLYFGTNNGMISFYPDQLQLFSKNFNIAITALNVNGAPVHINEPVNDHVILTENITDTRHITLTHRQARLFGLDFTGFNFNKSNIVYAMKIDDMPWQILGTQRQLTFSELSSGQHRLYLQAFSPGEKPSDQNDICTLDITVRPSFWASWPAFIIYSIFILMICLFIFRLMKIRLKYENSLKLERMEKIHTQELNRQKIGFFTNISHELKTPLTLILSPLNMMMKDKTIPIKTRKQVEVVTRNAQRMLTMIDELMTFSKIEMGQAKIIVQQGAILPFIEDMCQIFKMVATERNLNLITDIDSTDTTEVWFSPSNVEKIIYNLLSNAFKFTPQNGTIILYAALQKHDDGQTFLHLEVCDTGIGIPVESISRIFDNYYQVNPSDKTKGSGIGLAFTKGLVSLYKGSIDVKSELGKGTVFTVELNVSEEAYSEEERSAIQLDKDTLSNYNYAIPNIDQFDNSALQIGGGMDYNLTTNATPSWSLKITRN